MKMQTLQQQDKQNKKTNYMFIVNVHCIDRCLLLLQIIDAKIENNNVKMSVYKPTSQVHKQFKDKRTTNRENN